MADNLLDKPREQKSFIVEHTHECRGCGKPVTSAAAPNTVVYCSYECYVDD